MNDSSSQKSRSRANLYHVRYEQTFMSNHCTYLHTHRSIIKRRHFGSAVSTREEEFRAQLE